MKTIENNFLQYWYTTIKPGTPDDLVVKWRDYVLSGIQRGADLVESIKLYINLDGSKVLDAGCGYGGASIAFSLAGCRVVGIDISNQYLRGAQIRAREDFGINNILFQNSSLEMLPFPSETFDIIIGSDVIEHVNNQEASVYEISRVLKHNGIAFLSFPNRFSPQNFMSDPHYGLFGVSVLPRRLASWYVTQFLHRSYSYSVGHFPISNNLRKLFLRNGLNVNFENSLSEMKFGAIRNIYNIVLSNTRAFTSWIIKKY